MRVLKYSAGTALAMLPVLLAVLSLAACNTVSGVGKDVSATGGAVSTTADKVKDKL